MQGSNLIMFLNRKSGWCGQSLFPGEVNVYYKPHSYSISAGAGVNWRITKKRI